MCPTAAAAGAVADVPIVAARVEERNSGGVGALVLLVASCESQPEATADHRFEPIVSRWRQARMRGSGELVTGGDGAAASW